MKPTDKELLGMLLADGEAYLLALADEIMHPGRTSLRMKPDRDQMTIVARKQLIDSIEAVARAAEDGL